MIAKDVWSRRGGSGALALVALFPLASCGTPASDGVSGADVAQVAPNFEFCKSTSDHDYTVRHDSEIDNGPFAGNRPHANTLQGSGILQRGQICSNARVLDGCFDRISSTQAFRAPNLMARLGARRIPLKRLMMAIAAQETHVGAIKDTRIGRRTFNGIGIMQTISTGWPATDSRWELLERNIAMQLEWGIRLLEEKSYIADANGRAVPIASNDAEAYVWKLAHAYNGNTAIGASGRAVQLDYADAVVGFYRNEIGLCSGISFPSGSSGGAPAPQPPAPQPPAPQPPAPQRPAPQPPAPQPPAPQPPAPQPPAPQPPAPQPSSGVSRPANAYMCAFNEPKANIRNNGLNLVIGSLLPGEKFHHMGIEKYDTVSGFTYVRGYFFAAPDRGEPAGEGWIWKNVICPL